MGKRWVSRLGIMLFVVIFTELIAWYRGSTYEALDWLVVIVLNSSTILFVLDLIVRWHSGSWLTVLIASGIFGMLHGTLITLAVPGDLPLSIVIFGTGMPALIFIAAYASFQMLYTGEAVSQYWWLALPLIGILHGLWIRWVPTLDAVSVDAIELTTVLPLTVIAMALLGISPLLPLPISVINREDWLLTPLEWLPVGGTLVVTLLLRVESGTLTMFPLLLSGIIIAILITLMWFYYSLLPRPEFSLNISPRNTIITTWMMSLIVFAGLAWVSYELPGNDSSPQFIVLFGSIIAFGISWPPIVSVYISIQAFIELSRQEY